MSVDRGGFENLQLLPGELNSQSMASLLVELAQQLDLNPAVPDRHGPATSKQTPKATERLVALAEMELRRRRLRSRFLPRAYFGEAGWAMLLDLFISHHRGRKVSTTSACLASEVPETTALRWLEALEKDGYVERRAMPEDKRVKHVLLTSEGYSAVCSILRSYPD